MFVGTLNGEVCSYVSVLPFPHPKVKNRYREHRIVVLPDFQGIGVGVLMTDWIAEYYKKNGKTMICTTSAPSLIHARRKSKKWALTHFGRKADKGTNSIMNTTSRDRITASFQYVGEKNNK